MLTNISPNLDVGGASGMGVDNSCNFCVGDGDGANDTIVSVAVGCGVKVTVGG